MRPVRAPVDTSPGLWLLERNTCDQREAYLGRIASEYMHSLKTTERLQYSYSLKDKLARGHGKAVVDIRASGTLGGIGPVLEDSDAVWV